MKKSNYSKNNHCKCGKLIQNDSHFCNSCSQLNIWQDGIRKTKKIIMYFCIDCGKSLSKNAIYHKTKRCVSCAARERVSRPGITFSLPKFLDNNPNWNNGASFEPYTIEFTKKLKESIRIRDNYECQNCSMTEEEHLIVVGKVLTIHHIDYNKKNCDENNLVTVCSSCNIRANYNRDYWYTFYNKIIDLKMAKYEKGKVLINVRPKNF